MQISDEMIDAAIVQRDVMLRDIAPEAARWPDDYDDDETAQERLLMRAALEAVAPMIRAAALEEAAKVAEVFGQGPSIVLDRQACEIAAAIRAMKEPT